MVQRNFMTDLLGSPRCFFGMNVVEVPPRVAPKIRLSSNVPVGDAFRAEFNDWLLQMFGTRDASIGPPRGTAYVFGSTFVVRSEDVMRLTSIA